VSKADLKLLTLVFLVKELKIDITKHNDYFNNEVEDYQNKLEGWDTAEYNKDSQLVFWLYQSIKTHKVIGRTKNEVRELLEKVAGKREKRKNSRVKLKEKIKMKKSNQRIKLEQMENSNDLEEKPEIDLNEIVVEELDESSENKKNIDHKNKKKKELEKRFAKNKKFVDKSISTSELNEEDHQPKFSGRRDEDVKTNGRFNGKPKFPNNRKGVQYGSTSNIPEKPRTNYLPTNSNDNGSNLIGKRQNPYAFENLHPSWQARIEQKQQQFLVPFEGKKIKL